jgi:tetratricopeptide (TPR) repeat protein
MARLALVTSVAVAWLVHASAALSHGAVPERIDALDEEIGHHPNDAALYEKRAELHALAHNWTQAAEDLEEARAIDPQRPGLAHRLADARLQLGDAESAIALASEAIAMDPEESRAYLVRARARAENGDLDGAAADLARVIALSEKAAPALYRERAEILERAGDRDAALAALSEGIADRGPLVTLIEAAVDLEARRGRPEAALAWVDRLEPPSVRAPKWQVRRGGLLERAGRPAEAREAYEAARRAIETLPPSRRDTPKSVALRAEIDARMRALLSGEVDRPPVSGTADDRFFIALMVVLAVGVLAFLDGRRRFAKG